jgi:hypothetical protein
MERRKIKEIGDIDDKGDHRDKEGMRDWREREN